MIAIRHLTGNSGLELVTPFYEEQAKRPGLRAEDLFFVAQKDDKVVGCFRFCFEENTSVLRSMVLHSDYRRHGIGTALLLNFETYLNEHQVRKTYCLPYAHLESFYGQIGFELVAESTTPLFLQLRLADYRQNPEKFICMVRH
ncbi:MAG: GNAT family N-acetyltransferase [Bdellovibrionales bacterium]|nr:GNAT family N-acetyltransferase [Bdellovibrionales bacterium]